MDKEIAAHAVDFALELGFRRGITTGTEHKVEHPTPKDPAPGKITIGSDEADTFCVGKKRFCASVIVAVGCECEGTRHQQHTIGVTADGKIIGENVSASFRKKLLRELYGHVPDVVYNTVYMVHVLLSLRASM